MRAAWCVGFAVAALGTAQPAAAQEDEVGIPVGSTPPAVTIEDLEGRPVALGQWVGKRPVLLEFWATWCPTCEALFPRMRAAHERYGNQVEFVVVAVAVNQSKNTIKRHLERHAMPFTVLWDTNGNAVRAFQAPVTGYVVMLDARGKVVYTGIGADQDLGAGLRRAVGGEGP